LANPELGSKQVCPNCQAKFYDLTKRPAHCPKCDTEFDPDEAIRSRRTRARSAAPEPEAEAEVERDEGAEDQVLDPAEAEEEDEEEDEVVTPELDEVIDDPVLAADDDDEAEPAPAVSEDLGEFTDEEEVEDDADVPFLEEDDEDEFDETEIEGLPGEGEDDR
jgi:uncharacterized protein (TIGR02300 family)